MAPDAHSLSRSKASSPWAALGILANPGFCRSLAGADGHVRLVRASVIRYDCVIAAGNGEIAREPPARSSRPRHKPVMGKTRFQIYTKLSEADKKRPLSPAVGLNRQGVQRVFSG